MFFFFLLDTPKVRGEHFKCSFNNKMWGGGQERTLGTNHFPFNQSSAL